MKTVIALVLTAAAVLPAQAQPYYDRAPPGYYPPPPGYGRPPPYYEREAFGRRCEVVLRSPYGPRPYICRIIEPKPIDMECACPPPDVGPEFPRSRYIPGRTVR